MSYARFSSDNFRCDVYVYQSEHGYLIHTATGRYPEPIPQVPDIMSATPEAWVKQSRAQSDYLMSSDLVPIDLPYAGDTFTVDTPAECAGYLCGLRAVGFRIPDYTIDALIEEAMEACN